MQQKIVEFGQRKFWTSSIDFKQLNEEIARYNFEGWRVALLVPNTAGLWGVVSYTILLEKDDQ